MWPRPVSNGFMGLLSSPPWQTFGLKVVALVLVLCVGAGSGWILSQRFHHYKITDQELLREAVTKYGPSEEAFEQQAAQGYYDDAAATGRLFKSPEYVQWSIVELAKIRAENGDVQGAKAAISKYAGRDLARRVAQAVATVQAARGDLKGGIETASTLVDSDEVLLAFALHQIRIADFDGALKTAEQMKSQSADTVFYEIGSALRLRNEQRRLRDLASRMSNHKLAVLFIRCAGVTVRPISPSEMYRLKWTPCDDALLKAREGKFAEADDLVRKDRCGLAVCNVATLQYAVDPQGAERLLREASDSHSMAFGLRQFVALAAKKGNIADAQRFLSELQRMGQNDLNARSSVLLATQEIARVWAIKEGPEAVLKWARSRPTPSERDWALIGMAEALGHARPGQASTE